MKLPTLKWFILPALTMLLLLGALLIYYYQYVPAKLTYFSHRNFRVLSVMSTQLSSHIENLVEAFKNAAEAENVLKAIKLVPNLNIVNPNQADGKSRLVEIELSARQEVGSVWLYFTYKGQVVESKKLVTLVARSDLKELMRPIASRDVFDDVLVAQEDGKVLYQQQSSRARITNIEDLLKDEEASKAKGKGEEGKDTSSAVVGKPSSRLKDVHIAGTDYKLFIQPVELFLPADFEKSQGRRLNWTVSGLISADRYFAEAKAVSYIVLIIMIFIGLMTVLSLPLLKVRYMGPKDRLRISDVFVLGATALIGSAVLAVFLIDLYSYRGMTKMMDRQLRDFATAISRNFLTEVKSLYHQLELLNQRGPSALDDRNSRGEPLSKTSVLTDRSLVDPDGDPYPYFEMAYWIDKDGQQRAKWTIKKENTPFLNLSERPYVQHVFDDRLWTIQDAAETFRFWLEPIYSRTTGENQVVLAMPLNKPGFSGWVAAINARLRSLAQPVIPPSFGYAIIDETGKVLFHSEEARNLRENLFEETDHNPFVKAAVFGRSSDWVDTSYEGRGYRFYVTPLEQMPWSLVVFRDKQHLRTANLEVLTVSMILFIFYATLLLIAGGCLHLYLSLSTRLRQHAWLWPDQSRIHMYFNVLLVNLFLCGAFVLVLYRLPVWQVLSAAFIIPAATLLLAYTLRKERTDFPLRLIAPWIEGKKFFTFRVGYVLAVVSLLLLLGVFPIVAFFKIATDNELVLLIKHGQLTIARSLERRVDRITTYYRNLHIEPNDPLVKRHLREELDQYYAFFFGTTVTEAPQDLFPVHKANFLTAKLEEVLAAIRIPYNQFTVETRGLARDTSADEAWMWDKDTAGHLVLMKSKHKTYLLSHAEGETALEARVMPRGLSESPVDKPPPHALYVSSLVPVWTLPKTVAGWVIGAVLCLWFLAVLVLTVRFVARRVFFLDFDLPLPSVGSNLLEGPIHKNLVLIGPPFSGKTSLLQRPDFQVLDLRRFGREGKWAETFNYSALKNATESVLAIDHFEYKREDPQANHQKLQFLEEVVGAGRPVVVAATSDPLTYPLLNGNAYQGTASGAEEADRWGEMLSRFVKVRVQEQENVVDYGNQLLALQERRASGPPIRSDLLSTLCRECAHSVYLQKLGKQILTLPELNRLTPSQLVDHITDQAEAYYRVLWANCTSGERFILYHLAKDGFVNPANPDISVLLGKRLILLAPDLRLMNESFRRFVLEECSRPETVSAWITEDETSKWNTLKVPLITILAGVALFLYLTQRDVFDTTIAFAAAVAAGLPAIFKLLGVFERKETGKSQ